MKKISINSIKNFISDKLNANPRLLPALGCLTALIFLNRIKSKINPKISDKLKKKAKNKLLNIIIDSQAQ